MSAVTAHILETPSKKVAAGLANIDVNHTPTKSKNGTGNFHAGANDNDDDDDDFSSEPSFLTKGPAPVKQVAQSNSAKHAAQEEADEDPRHRFVGDINLKEEDEPLLVESSRRFVLFPIKYHEVSWCFFCIVVVALGRTCRHHQLSQLPRLDRLPASPGGWLATGTGVVTTPPTMY